MSQSTVPFSSLRPVAAARPLSDTRPARLRRQLLNGLLIFLIGFFVARLPATLAQIAGKGDFLQSVNDVYVALMAGAVDEPDPAKLQKGAIDGMLEALNDDYAQYIPEDEAEQFEKDMTGQFSGIGCQIDIRDGWLTVVSPIEDSPAFNAGIMAGDRIEKIGDRSTFGLSADECIKLLTGPPGTEVSFTVRRDGIEIPYTLKRAPITSKSVRGIDRDAAAGKWQFLVDHDNRIGYIRLSQFTPSAAEEVAEALKETFKQAQDAGGDLNGLILDLRNNPGGVMDGALAIADMFLDSGVIMSIRGRTSPPVEFEASAQGTVPNFPMAVLVNENSASASEIVAGALKDHHRAVIIGERTFGKGLVQTVMRLRHAPKAQVKFTTQRYYLPSGRMIQRSDDSTEWGVDPNEGFYVPMTDREKVDAILKRREWDILKKDAKPSDLETHRWSDPEWVRNEARDKQLAAAIQAVQTRIAAGVTADAGGITPWKPVSDVEPHHGKIAVKELQDLKKTRQLLSIEFARIEKRIQALRKQADSGDVAEKKLDLWSDEIDLTGGRIEVFDKDGHVVARLKVTGRDVERFLLPADVAPDPAAAPAEVPAESHP
jgi:carboxyl-terminal processing protease